MAERIRKTRTTQSEKQAEVAEATTTPEKDEALAAETDALLDEIDELLETNAQEFVANYVQQGGE